MSPRRALIAAGGTGGHFYPGLVLAKTLQQRGWQPLMLVRHADPALPRLEEAAVPAATLDLEGLPRRPGAAWLRFGWKLASALRQAGCILRDFSPDVVAGMGGYLTFPAALAARRQGVPCLVHESNTVLGLANRAALALGASLLRGLPAAAGEPAGRLTGTPVRPSLWQPGPAPQARARLGLDQGATTVLAFGGSQGARGLNRCLPQALAQAAGSCAGLQVLHLAGARSAEEVTSAYAAAAGTTLRYRVLPYLDAMEDAYAAADLVICRSGASTLAELAGLRKPAVLVPFPHATGGHQEANARLLAEAGAARLVPEEQLAARLAGELSTLLADPGARTRMSASYARLELPCGAEAVSALADAVEQAARP